MLLDDRHDDGVEGDQRRHHRLRIAPGGEGGKAADVEDDDRRAALDALAGDDGVVRAGDRRLDRRRQEAADLGPLDLFARCPEDELLGSCDGDGEDRRHRHHDDDLVDLGADQDPRAVDIVDEAAGDRAGAVHRDGMNDQQHPAERGNEAGEQHPDRLEAQRPERDEDEDVEDRRCLEGEGLRLLVLQMERPDQDIEQRHVGEKRGEQEQLRQRGTIGQVEAQQRQAEIGAEAERHEAARHGIDRLGRDEIEAEDEGAEGELHPAGEPLAGGVKPHDVGHDAGGNGACGARGDQTLQHFCPPWPTGPAFADVTRSSQRSIAAQRIGKVNSV